MEEDYREIKVLSSLKTFVGDNGAASSCAGGDEDDFSSDGEQGPTLTIVKKRQKQPADVVDGSPTGSSNLTPVKQRFELAS